MKEFKNSECETVKMGDNPQELVPADYAYLAKIALNYVNPRAPMNADQMRKRMKVLDKLEGAKVDAVIELEDSEAQTLYICLKGFNWPFAPNKDIVAFDDYAMEALK